MSCADLGNSEMNFRILRHCPDQADASHSALHLTKGHLVNPKPLTTSAVRAPATGACRGRAVGNARLAVRAFFAATLFATCMPCALAADMIAQPAAHGPALRYGNSYHLQNAYANWTGGYLDTRGGPCNSNALCVSTATVDDRDQGSGSWVIASAEGRPDGTPVMAGEKVFLKNQYPLGTDDMPPYGLFGGYLDTRGDGCQGNLLCVSSSLVPNTNVDTSVWTLSSGDRLDLYVGQPLHVQNQYPDPQGLAYLDVRGSGCNGNLLCVSASIRTNL
jgi:hypothetical protein